MTPRPSNKLIVGMALLLIAATVLIALAVVSSRPDKPTPRAATSEPTPDSNMVTLSQVVDITITAPAPTATPEPVALTVTVMVDEPMRFDHDVKDVEALARLLWSSPLRGEWSKRLLLWVVLNRVDAGLGGDSIQECVNKTEFGFFDPSAHRSDANMAIARDVLDMWRSEKAGLTVARPIPPEVLYIRFGADDPLEVMTEAGGDAYDWRAWCLFRRIDA